MDDEDPFSNGGAAIVVISLSIIKRVHICGLPIINDSTIKKAEIKKSPKNQP
jgi:hypothetical protein